MTLRVERRQLARDRDQAIAAITAVRPSSSGTPAATSDAEGDRQDQQGDRQREQLRPCRGRAERLVRSSLFALALAELLDLEIGVGRPATASMASCAGSTVPSPSVVAGDLELDQRRMPVGRDRASSPSNGECDVLDVLGFGRSRSTSLDHGLELRVVDRQRLALHEHDLVVRAQPGVVERPLGLVGLAGELVDGVDLPASGSTTLCRPRREDDERRASPRSRACGGRALQRPHPGREVVATRVGGRGGRSAIRIIVGSWLRPG